MRRGFLSVVVLVLVAAGVLPVMAQGGAESGVYTPVMLSFASPLQVTGPESYVGGLRLSVIYGECRDFHGLDIAAIAARTKGDAVGIQLAGVANVVNGDGRGLQIGSVNYVEGSYEGMQIGAVNYAANRPDARAQVFQIGVYNGSDFIKGCQIGVINISRDMIGLQIGLINVIQNKDVPFLPLINGYF